MAYTTRIQVFQGANRRWYFHRQAANGRITDASQGYRWKRTAVREARKRWPGTTIQILPPKDAT